MSTRWLLCLAFCVSSIGCLHEWRTSKKMPRTGVSSTALQVEDDLSWESL